MLTVKISPEIDLQRVPDPGRTPPPPRRSAAPAVELDYSSGCGRIIEAFSLRCQTVVWLRLSTRLDPRIHLFRESLSKGMDCRQIERKRRSFGRLCPHDWLRGRANASSCQRSAPAVRYRPPENGLVMTSWRWSFSPDAASPVRQSPSSLKS